MRKICKQACISYVLACVLDIFAAVPYAMMNSAPVGQWTVVEAAGGHLHYCIWQIGQIDKENLRKCK